MVKVGKVAKIGYNKVGKVEINVSDVNGDADIAVIVNSTKADGNGGISKPVVITD